MGTIVEIIGLTVKIDIVPIDGILTVMCTKSKIEVLIEVSKTIVAKIVVLTIEEHKIVKHPVSIVDDYNLGVEEEGGCSLVDEVEVTFVNDVLSYVGEKSDWMFEVPVVVTIKNVEDVSKLDVATGLLGE